MTCTSAPPLRWLVAGVCLVAVSLGLIVKPITTANRVARTGICDLVAEPPCVDFGAVHPAEQLTATFRLENQTGEIVQIVQVLKSCGCTDAAIDRQVLKPGENCTVTVRWHPTGAGPRNETVAVSYRQKGKLEQSKITICMVRCQLPVRS